MKSVIFAILLFCGMAAQSQDSVTITVKVPKPKPDTIVIRDTVYYCPEGPQKKDSMFLSEFEGSLKNFIAAAQEAGLIPVVDQDVLTEDVIGVRDGFVLYGKGRPTISTKQRWLFWIYEGTHVIDGFDIELLADNGTAFYVEPKTGTYTVDSIRNINIKGGENGYLSSRGGLKDKWSIAYLENVGIDVSKIGISIFSQDGPYKALHINDVWIKTVTSHNIYCHPNVSLLFYKLLNVSSGKLGLHHFSFLGQSGEASYVILVKCSTSVNTYAPYELASGKTTKYIDSCDIGLYTTVAENIDASNTNFQKKGGAPAAFKNSFIRNCTGYIWPFNSSIYNCNFEEVRLAKIGEIKTGLVLLFNTNVKYMGGGGEGNGFTLSMTNSQAKASFTTTNSFPSIYLHEGSTIVPWSGKLNPEIRIVISEN